MPPRAFLALALCLCLTAGTAWADIALVTAANANLRSAPGTSGRVVATLARGAKLEVLDASGDWLKVRVADTKAEGWVHRRLVERVPAASSAPPAPLAPKPSPPAASAPVAAAVTIEHREVGCIVAGQYPKLDACFSPDASVGRGRVLFRAAGTDPWYYVDMSRDGPCYSAVLPRPKPDLKAFEYFVDVIDKAFAEASKPDRAPEQAFSPRVVKKQGDCDPARKMALFLPRLLRPIVVGIARDPAGRVLSAVAAKALEGQALLAGFSTDGVIVSSGAAPGAASGSSSAGSASATATGGVPKIAIVGGAVAAAAVVALVAAKGGGSSSGGSASASPGGGTGGSGGSGGQGSSLAGPWVGNSAGGNGLRYQFGVEDVSCTFNYDTTLNLTASGTNVGGSMTYAGRTHTCTVPDSAAQQIINSALAGVPGDAGGFPVSGTTDNAGSVTLTMGGISFTGTYNATSMNLTANAASTPGLTQFSMTMKLVR